MIFTITKLFKNFNLNYDLCHKGNSVYCMELKITEMLELITASPKRGSFGVRHLSTVNNMFY
ncbi:MAG TPA: hypothetical protein DCX92_11065 [Bacteroidetes bacterium]|nr:hypothetical protein [Bacteroidota bacterium]